MRREHGVTCMTSCRETLFGGTDIDYRDTDVSAQPKPAASTTVDSDRMFELNSKCLSLAEEKYKSNELSSEEYQATLKLLQNILQNEAQRLTQPSMFVSPSPLAISSELSFAPSHSSANPSLINGLGHPATIPPTTSLPSLTTAPSNSPFPHSFLSYAAQNPMPMSLQAPSSSATFPFAGFGNDAQRHALQILATVGAPPSFTSQFNLLPYLPPLPPAPPAFTLVSNTFPSPPSSSSASSHSQPVYHPRRGQNKKRSHDENSKDKRHFDKDHKRLCHDSKPAHAIHSHKFDDESIAPVPSLLDANVNTLKK